jgi:hypothetical protein
MLWLKGWLETRFRLLFMLGFMGFYLAVFYSMRNGAAPPGAKPAAIFAMTAIVFAVILYAWLAGAGVVTQPSFQATKGIHGSTLFTLSLPVSRLRLLAVRATLGWLELTLALGAWCFGSWLVLPVIRGSVTATELIEFTITLVVCVSGLYFLSVLLATFLDEQWRMWATIMASGAFWWLPSHLHLPVSADIFRGMSEGSPLLAHSIPWITMAFSLELAAILFFAALKVVQMREY